MQLPNLKADALSAELIWSAWRNHSNTEIVMTPSASKKQIPFPLVFEDFLLHFLDSSFLLILA